VKAALSNQVVGVAVMANQDSFRYHKTGLITGCSGRYLDHEILLVGWGKDDKTGYDYWLVQNSWGTRWGEDGYAKVEIVDGINSACGITQDAQTVEVASR
jgi:C1A family cysteine protease